MFFKNLLFAFRNFRKNKITTAINILGLAVGISASVIIFLIVRYDYSFDKWEPQRDNIYRVYTEFPGGANYGISLLAPKAIEKNVAGINALAHVIKEPFYDATISTGIKADGAPVIFPNEEGIIAADAQYFNIFPHTWLAGTSAALKKLNTVVISKSTADKFFPGQSAGSLIGKTLVFQDTINTVIGGVVEDIRAHTDFKDKIFISLNTFIQTSLLGQVASNPHWTNVDGISQCFVLLQPGVNPEVVNTRIKKIYFQNQDGTDTKNFQTGKLQPLSDIHFNTDLDGKVSKSSLRNLGILALLLLLLAAINFINLATAQSTLRSREIGVRKTFGGSNRQIIFQFLSEIMLITLFASILALLIAPFLLHVFKDFVPQGLNFKEMMQPAVLAFLVGIIIIVTLMAGLYPALVLTKFRPALVLKSNTSSQGSSRSGKVRQVLIITQFVLAQVFLIVVFVIGKQIHYELNKDIGVKKEAIVSVIIPDFGAMHQSKSGVLVSELKKISQIKNASLCSREPIAGGWSSTAVTWYDQGIKRDYDDVHVRTADGQYLDVFGLQLLAGKNLKVDSSRRVTDVLINESLLHRMGLHNPENALGQFISGGPTDSARIVGVLKDFTTMSLHNPIYPTVVFAGDNGFAPTLSVALAGHTPSEWKAALNKFENIYKDIYPYKEFDARFLDESIKNLYQSDIRLSTLLKWATGLAIFISCLGLLGLVSFMANQRTKEIGIRKVLGASVLQIIHMLSKHMIRLVVLASVIAFPIGWYFSQRWLQDYTFKTTLSWWIFCISGIGMLLLALTVLCLRTFKTAKANPLTSLKEE